MNQTDNQIINKDYIGVVVENDNGLLEYSQIPIDRNQIAQAIIKMANEKWFSIQEMNNKFKTEYPDEKGIDYIYPNEYYEAWIDETKYPIFNYTETRKYVVQPIRNAQCEDEILKLLCDKLGCKFKKIEELFDNYLYKNVQLNNFLNYIYASDYTNKISEIKQNDKIKMYSTDTLGHSTFKYVINGDITIWIKTNFGYGSAAYFVCLLKYKNVTILPYTVVVNYYLVNWTKLLKCTRDYYPRRENWIFLFEYVVRIANLIKTDLEGFKNEVLNDVKTMVDGLEETFRTPETCLQRFLNVKKEDFELSRRDSFRIVKIISEQGINQYKVYPKEKVLVFKVAKISGCLELLDNLRQLKEFIPELGKYRQRIKELNLLLSPEISNAISVIKTEIEPMDNNLHIMAEQFDDVLKDIHQQDLIRNKYVHTDFDDYKSMLISHIIAGTESLLEYFKEHRLKASQNIEELYKLIVDLETKLEYRKHFLESLEKGKNRIERYLHTK